MGDLPVAVHIPMQDDKKQLWKTLSYIQAPNAIRIRSRCVPVPRDRTSCIPYCLSVILFLEIACSIFQNKTDHILSKIAVHRRTDYSTCFEQVNIRKIFPVD